MGGGISTKAVQCQIGQTIKVIGKLQKAARDAGIDPEVVDLNVTSKTYDC
jgi:hypothetical protein